ncbi:hypothetical protein ACFFX0_17535 [Citricoccus parietis]|uniref:Uncharacterized protein n=1 Tax=Citricoccus parietis TaxID=592307 RepID=A0ABV5G1U7_9MICC
MVWREPVIGFRSSCRSSVPAFLELSMPLVKQTARTRSSPFPAGG